MFKFIEPNFTVKRFGACSTRQSFVFASVASTNFAFN